MNTKELANAEARVKKSVRPYYEDMGAATDWIVRCKDCLKLQTAAQLQEHGTCECGNRKMTEVRTLSEEEMADITNGVIDFPHRDKFLAEFAPRG
jgi:hypothetical protein